MGIGLGGQIQESWSKNFGLTPGLYQNVILASLVTWLVSAHIGLAEINGKAIHPALDISTEGKCPGSHCN